MRHSLSITMAAALLLALGGCNRHADGRPWADRAWVRLAALPGRPAAAYLTLHAGSAPVRMIGIDSTAAGSSELHAMRDLPGSERAMPMMHMDPIDGIDVPAGGAVTLASGGYHAMLFGVAPGVRPGSTVPLRVRLAGRGPVAVDARVIAAGDPAPE